MHHEIVTWALKKGLAYPGRVDQFTFAWQFRQAANAPAR